MAQDRIQLTGIRLALFRNSYRNQHPPMTADKESIAIVCTTQATMKSLMLELSQIIRSTNVPRGAARFFGSPVGSILAPHLPDHGFHSRFLV
jgi:hypothetical protein